MSNYDKYKDFIFTALHSNNKKAVECTELISDYSMQKVDYLLSKRITKYYLDSNDIRHITKHGNEKREKANNQLPITENDILIIPEILAEPTEIELGTLNAKNGQSVRFIKEYPDGRIFCVLIDALEANELSLKTSYKKPPLRGIDALALLQSPNSNVRNDNSTPMLFAKVSNFFVIQKENSENLGMSMVGRRGIAQYELSRKRKNNKIAFTPFWKRRKIAEFLYANDFGDGEILYFTNLYLGKDLIWKQEFLDFANITEENLKQLEAASRKISFNELRTAYEDKICREAVALNTITPKVKEYCKNWYWKGRKKECNEKGFLVVGSEIYEKKGKTIFDYLKEYHIKENIKNIPEELSLKYYVTEKFLDLYPFLNDCYLHVSNSNPNWAGCCQQKNIDIVLLDKAGNRKTIDELNKVFNHELQHLIQRFEGFDSGDNSKGEKYAYSSGEWEARIVEQRISNRDKLFPYTEDYLLKNPDNSKFWVHDKKAYNKRKKDLDKLKQKEQKTQKDFWIKFECLLLMLDCLQKFSGLLIPRYFLSPSSKGDTKTDLSKYIKDNYGEKGIEKYVKIFGSTKRSYNDFCRNTFALTLLKKYFSNNKLSGVDLKKNNVYLLTNSLKNAIFEGSWTDKTYNELCTILNLIDNGRLRNERVSQKRFGEKNGRNKIWRSLSIILGGSRCSTETFRESGYGRQCNDRSDAAARRIQFQITENFAKYTSFWFENAVDYIKSLGATYKTQGSEARIYLSNDEQFVYKTKNVVNGDFLRFFDELINHNIIFPETRYDILGFGLDENKNFCTILKQTFIKGRPATFDEIEQHFSKMKYEKCNQLAFKNNKYVISDLKRANIVYRNGLCYVIDCYAQNIFDFDDNLYIVNDNLNGWETLTSEQNKIFYKFDIYASYPMSSQIEAFHSSYEWMKSRHTIEKILWRESISGLVNEIKRLKYKIESIRSKEPIKYDYIGDAKCQGRINAIVDFLKEYISYRANNLLEKYFNQ